MTESQSLVERLAGEAGFFDGSLTSTHDRCAKFAELVAADLATAWQEANGFDKHGVGEFIRQRFGVGE